MRTNKELEEAFSKIGSLLDQEDFEDDVTIQAIYETLKWFDGHDWQPTVGQYLPD